MSPSGMVLDIGQGEEYYLNILTTSLQHQYPPHNHFIGSADSTEGGLDQRSISPPQSFQWGRGCGGTAQSNTSSTHVNQGPAAQRLQTSQGIHGWQPPDIEVTRRSTTTNGPEDISNIGTVPRCERFTSIHNNQASSAHSFNEHEVFR